MFLGEIGALDPATAGLEAAGKIGPGLIDVVAGWFGGTSATKIAEKQIKAQAMAAKAAAAAQAQQIMAGQQQVSVMQRALDDQRAFDTAQKARDQQVMALYAVGGVAVLVAGFFLVKAMSKPSSGRLKKG